MRKILLSLSNSKFSAQAIDFALNCAADNQSKVVVSYFVDEHYVERFTENLKVNYFLGPQPAKEVARISWQAEFRAAHELLDQVFLSAAARSIDCHKIFVRGSDYLKNSFRLVNEYDADLLVACGKSSFRPVIVIDTKPGHFKGGVFAARRIKGGSLGEHSLN